MESKILKNGNHIDLVISEPEIFRYPHKGLDFAVLASDGVFDKLTNQQIVETVWETIDYYKKKYQNICANRKPRARQSSIGRKNLMKMSLNSKNSSKLSAHIAKISKGKSYSQVFDEAKSKRNTLNGKVKAKSRIFDSNVSKNTSKQNTSNTSIALTAEEGSSGVLEPWMEELQKKYEDILGECVNNILKRALLNQSDDNVTLIMLVFSDLLKE